MILHRLRRSTNIQWSRLFIILVCIMIVFICSRTVADDFVPFVIPGKPNADSLIAAAPGEPICPGSERLVVRSGHFCRDTERVRLWGVNLSFGANFPTHADAPHVAARLAAAGVNTVRCHHMDTARWPRGLWNAKDGKTIESEALDRLDFFIDQLARRGICVNINLHVGRAHSEYLGLPETNRQYDKISNIFTPALIDAQKQFARELLTHTNPYRKVRYADDPAVAIVEITNENSFFMWSSEPTLRTLPPYYGQILQKKFNAWLRERYGSNERLRTAWANGTRPLGKDLLTSGGVTVYADDESPQRVTDRMRFLAETEKQYFDGMRNFIKNDLGCKALVTGTIVFGPLGLYAQSDMDFIDAHAYWQHPRFPGRPWDQGNWLISQKPMTDYPAEATLFRLAAERLAGKPFTVSEYNHPAPLDSQAACIPMIASFGAAQDWDGIWLYTYSHGTDDWYRQNMNGFFDIDTNPAKWGFMRAGTAIFRDSGLGHVDRFELFGLREPSGGLLVSLERLHRKYDRNLAQMLAGEAEISWRDMLGMAVSLSFDRRKESKRVRPDVSPAMIEWIVEDGRGLYHVQGNAGVLIGRTSRFEQATDEDIRISDPSFAVLTYTPLDGMPVGSGSKILITACGRCENAGMKFSEDRRTVGRNWGGPPVQIETVTGTVAIPEGQWKCEALGPDGIPKREVPISNGVLKLSPEYETMWYLLTR